MRHRHPRFCPRSDCPSHSTSGPRQPFRFRQHGSYERRCDRRRVYRFLCLTCSRTFSSQTFRVDYRLKRPELLARFFADRVSKVTHRQSARIHGCARRTEERHFRRLREHCRDFHQARLAEIVRRGGLGREFLLDELETYQEHRLKKPVTVPVLIERESGFVLDFRVGTLPARKSAGLDPRERRRRKSQSKQRVQAVFERLRELLPDGRRIVVITDQKATYVPILKRLFGARCTHERISAKRERNLFNPLFKINHTFARLRDGISRLVRETWAAAKKRRPLAGHLAIWTCYRNYIRGRINREPRDTPAMWLGLESSQWSVDRLLSKRVFPPKFTRR